MSAYQRAAVAAPTPDQVFVQLGPHRLRIAPHREAVFDGPAHVAGVGEEIECAAFADGKLGRERGAVLSRPGVHRPEEDAMGVEHVLVAQDRLCFQPLQRREDVRGEGLVLEVLDGFRVFFPGEVPEVAARCEIAEGIERHQARDWRR
jgi:hypothetical protein